MWSPSPLQRSATVALSDRLRELLPRGPHPAVDRSGYVVELYDNLLPHLSCEQAGWVATQLQQGDGHELAERADGRPPKAHAAHSSAALAGNTFAGFHGHEADLTLAGLSGFQTLRLEAKHHPLPERVGGSATGDASAPVDERRPANLDAELVGPGVVVGVESKLTEHLAARDRDRWRWEYRRTEVLAPLPAPWRDAIRRRTTGATTPSHLDAQQLLKHALGICRSARDGAFGPDPVDLHLVYLYWEPADGDAIDAVVRHREEVAAFAEEVGGGGFGAGDAHEPGPSLTFHATTHRELWDAWETADAVVPRVARHAAALRERYDVAIDG